MFSIDKLLSSIEDPHKQINLEVFTKIMDVSPKERVASRERYHQSIHVSNIHHELD